MTDDVRIHFAVMVTCHAGTVLTSDVEMAIESLGGVGEVEATVVAASAGTHARLLDVAEQRARYGLPLDGVGYGRLPDRQAAEAAQLEDDCDADD